MIKWQGNRAMARLSVLAAVALNLLIGGAFQMSEAAPQALDCLLTDIETKSGGTKFDSQVAAEKRTIVVTFDEKEGALSFREGAADKRLQNVTITQTSMNGAADDISLGIDRSSWRIVFQTYGQDSLRNEFGICNLRPKTGG